MSDVPAALAAIKQWTQAKAAEEGMRACRVTTPGAVSEAGERLYAWLAADRHGELEWMADRVEWRSDPRALWPEARSILMFGEPYGPDDDPLGALERRTELQSRFMRAIGTTTMCSRKSSSASGEG